MEEFYQDRLEYLEFVKHLYSCGSDWRGFLRTNQLSWIHFEKVKPLFRFEGLGPDYYLGRLAITEIEEYRLDKKY